VNDVDALFGRNGTALDAPFSPTPLPFCPPKRPRTKASKKRLMGVKDDRRKKKTASRVMPNR